MNSSPEHQLKKQCERDGQNDQEKEGKEVKHTNNQTVCRVRRAGEEGTKFCDHTNIDADVIVQLELTNPFLMKDQTTDVPTPTLRWETVTGKSIYIVRV